MYTFSPWSLWCFAFMSTSQGLGYSLVLFLLWSLYCSRYCGALPRSAFQTGYSLLHLLAVLAAEGSQLSPYLGTEIQKGAALPKIILPSLQSGGRTCIQWLMGPGHTGPEPLLWFGITPKARTYQRCLQDHVYDVYSWTLCYNCRACQLLPLPNQLASIISSRC